MIAAASSRRNFQIQNHTRVVKLLVSLWFRSSHQRVPRGFENFGIGTPAEAAGEGNDVQSVSGRHAPNLDHRVAAAAGLVQRWQVGRPMKNILGAQMRAARALLRWAAADLVRESGVSLATIHRAESIDGKTAMTFANASAIRRALENAGVELIEENGGGPGARLKQHLSDKSDK